LLLEIRMHRALAGIAFVLVCVCSSGCGAKPTGPAKVAVEGKVTHGGKGVAWLLVTFNGATPEVKYETNTEKDGTFKLSCPPGTYKVSFTPVPLGQGQGPGGGAGGGTLVDLPDAKGLKEVPERYRSPRTSRLTVEVPEEGKKDLVLAID
jgi:hypothetical protein